MTYMKNNCIPLYIRTNELYHVWISGFLLGCGPGVYRVSGKPGAALRRESGGKDDKPG